MKLLVVEDNQELLDIIVVKMVKDNCQREKTTNYDAADENHLYTYDILIIDINLPGSSGLDLIRYAKKSKQVTGIIAISARNSLENKIEELDLCAAGYITKPFDVTELAARIKSLIRRRNFSGSETITYNEITIDTIKRTVFTNNTKIELTKSEFDILLFFFSNPGRILTKKAVAEHIQGNNVDLVDSFDFTYPHIKNIRKKITARGIKIPIKAVYGMGYKLEKYICEAN